MPVVTDDKLLHGELSNPLLGTPYHRIGRCLVNLGETGQIWCSVSGNSLPLICLIRSLPCAGFQLWINLPKKHKMVKPRYQDYQASEIPVVEQDGLKVRVMAGESHGAVGPIKVRPR